LSYTLLDLQSAVQDDLQDSNFSTSRITRYLNYGQLVIFNTHLFRFCEESVQGPLTIGSYAYAQQSNHQQTIRGIVYDPSNTGRRLILDENTYIPHRQFFDQYPAPDLETSGFPSAWTEFGRLIYFNCPMYDDYTFKQRYFRAPTSMSAPTDVPDAPEAFRELLELYALFRSEKKRGNHDIAATHKQDFEDGLENMALRYGEPTQVAPVQIPSARTRVEL
jgi:hypothetical protein